MSNVVIPTPAALQACSLYIRENITVTEYEEDPATLTVVRDTMNAIADAFAPFVADDNIRFMVTDARDIATEITETLQG